MREPSLRPLAGLAAASLALAAAGCAVGPNYEAPAVPLDPSFVNAASGQAQPPGADIATFWRGGCGRRSRAPSSR